MHRLACLALLHCSSSNLACVDALDRLCQAAARIAFAISWVRPASSEENAFRGGRVQRRTRSVLCVRAGRGFAECSDVCSAKVIPVGFVDLVKVKGA